MTIYSKDNHPTGFYVYSYLREDGTPYYIGKGKAGRAWHRFKDETQKPTDTSRIVIIASDLCEKDAFLLETAQIALYGRKDIGTGILRNRTNGGEGPSGYTWTEEHHKNFSAVTKGKPSKLKGTKLKPEHIARSAAARRGMKQPNITSAKLGKVSPILGYKYATIICPHCGKEGKPQMKRYHFDKCKNRDIL